MNRDKLRAIYNEYGLTPDDTFTMRRGGRDIPMITRPGLDKIQRQLSDDGWQVEISLKHCNADATAAVVMASAHKDGGVTMVESFGEANDQNCQNPYRVAMAEKRARGRVILRVAGLYELGVHTEDEFGGGFEYDPEPLYQLIETSTYDSDQQTAAKIAAQNLKSQDDYTAFYFKLQNNQLRPIDRPHGRMSAKEIKDAI